MLLSTGWSHIAGKRHSVVLATARGDREAFAGFEVQELLADPLRVALQSKNPFELGAQSPRAAVWAPTLLALAYAGFSIVLVFVVPEVLTRTVAPLPWLAALPSLVAVVLSICWVVWPPRSIYERPMRLAAVVVSLAIGLCFSQLTSAPDGAPTATRVWNLLGSVLTVAALLALVFRRRGMATSVRRSEVLFCVSLLVAAWLAVGTDPVFLAAGLLGTLLATTHFQPRAEAVVLSAVIVTIGVDLALNFASRTSSAVSSTAIGIDDRLKLIVPDRWPIIVPAAVLAAAGAIRLCTLRPERARPGKARRVVPFAGWFVLWAVAPLPAVAAVLEFSTVPDFSLASFIRLDFATGFIWIGMAAGMAGVLLGWVGALVCSLVPVSAWVRRLSLSLPVIGALTVVVGQAPAEVLPPMWMLTGLGVLMVAAVLLPTREPLVTTPASPVRDVAVALSLLGGASLVLAAAVPWFVQLANESLDSVIGNLPVSYAKPWLETSSIVQYAYNFTLTFRSSVAGWAVLLLTLAAVLVGLFGGVRRGWPSSETKRTGRPAWPDSALGRATPGTVHIVGALAMGLLLTAHASDANRSVVPGFHPLLWLEHEDLANILVNSVCVLVCISAWLWRHGTADWVVPLILVALPLLRVSGGHPTDATFVIAFWLAAMFIGGPSTVLAPRRGTWVLNLAVCLLAVALCAVFIWMFAVPRSTIVVGNFDVPEFFIAAALLLMAVIIRQGNGSPLSLRVDRFRRGARRVALITAFGVLLIFVPSFLVTFGGLTGAEAATAACWTIWAATTVWGWLSLDILARSVGARRRPGLAGLRQEVDEFYGNADAEVAPWMQPVEAAPGDAQPELVSDRPDLAHPI